MPASGRGGGRPAQRATIDTMIPRAPRAPGELAALAVALTALAGCDGGEPRPRNVLLVTLDTTRADALGCYGAGGDPTPRFDALAAEGTRFDLAIATAAVTPVSHASILSGRDNPGHRLRVISAASGYRLPDDVPTLATVLKEQGYDTAAVHSAFPVSAHFGLDRGYDVFESFDEPADDGPGWDVLALQRRSDATTDLALEVAGRLDDPFFLWVHYWDPHDPARLPPPEFLPADLPRDAQGGLAMSRELYAAEVRYLDLQFGRLVDGLKQQGRWDDTLVVVVADHGEGLGDHGWAHHRILYQEQVRVPAIVRVPGTRTAPVVGEVVRAYDLAPTVLDYLGLPRLAQADGESLRPALEGRAGAPRVAFADQVNGYDLNAKMLEKRPDDDFLYMAIEMPWKLVYRPARPARSELYHLVDDPRELANRHAQEREVAARLLAKLARRGGWVTAPFPPEGDPRAAAAAQRALGGLGYVEGAAPPAAAEARWAWTCAAHPAWRAPEADRCPTCGEPPVLIAADG